jgi:hypothetical protein
LARGQLCGSSGPALPQRLALRGFARARRGRLACRFRRERRRKGRVLIRNPAAQRGKLGRK